MFILAHVGITLGLAEAVASRVARARPVAAPRPPTSPVARAARAWPLLWPVLLGSMLPDIVDKPLGLWLLRDQLANGRLFTHSAVLWLCLTAVAVALLRSRGLRWPLVVCLAAFCHLLLDSMWQEPGIALWPAMGVTFPRLDTSETFGKWVRSLLTDPLVLLPELIGTALITRQLWLSLRGWTGPATRLVRAPRSLSEPAPEAVALRSGWNEAEL